MRTDPRELHRRDGTCDVVVAGGGIQGVAIARELVLRGADVVLVDRDDFAGGASMRSSRLVHGGLRYLAQGHLALVREALTERERLFRQLPHLVRAQPMLLPFYPDSGGSRPWMMNLGVRLYSLLARRSTLPRPRSLSADEAARAFPGIRTRGLRRALQFWDGATEDLPLTFAVLDDAVAHGLRACNYVEVVGADGDGLRLLDRTNGDELRLRAKALVNAAGPFADPLRAALGLRDGPLMRTSRGSHVVLDPREGCLALAAFLPDDRIQFVIPHEDGTVCGTTEVDEPAEGDPTVPEDDLRYLLDALEYLLDPAPVRADLRFAYAGWRALPAQKGPSGGVNREAHLVTEAGPLPVHTVVGGKLTTHRALAERVAVGLMGPGPSPTRDRAPRCGLGPQEPSDPLWRRHGSHAVTIRALERELGVEGVVGPARPFTRAEAIHAVQAQGVVRFEDLALRRLFHSMGPCLDDAWLRPLFDIYAEHGRGGEGEDYAAAAAQLRARVARMTGALVLSPETRTAR